MNILVNSIWTKEKFFMINMAVVSVKDVIKYFFKITILIVITLATVKYFSQGKDEIKRKVNLKPFMDQNVLIFLEKENKWDLYEKNLLNYLESPTEQGQLIYFPFIINSFIWRSTDEGMHFWIELSRRIDPMENLSISAIDYVKKQIYK